ncbi:unnamed protein product, partial [Heterotrigona itama]
THPRVDKDLDPACANGHGSVRKYGLNIHRQYFKKYAADIDFKKLD